MTLKETIADAIENITRTCLLVKDGKESLEFLQELSANACERISTECETATLEGLVESCHRNAYASGWWLKSCIDPASDPCPGLPDSVRKFILLNVMAAKHSLIHSELSEALEGLRKDCQDDHLPHRKMLEVELADTFIRMADFIGALRRSGMDIDIVGAIREKMAYNKQRADHKPEARAAAGGKQL